MNYHGRALIYSAGMASDTSASAALAQSSSFCTVGAPLSPIAPTTSPSTLMGNPPPYGATRASVGMPAKSDGSPWIKSKKSCVGTPNRAVYALFCAISMHRIGAPSIRLKALRLPPSSRIATFSQTPSSLAFATAAAAMFCASSEEMLCFFITLAIGHLPPLNAYCELIHVSKEWGVHILHETQHSCCITLPGRPLPLHRRFDLRSGVDAAIDRQVGAVDERRLRTGDKGDKRRDLVGASIPAKRNGRLLACGPLAGGGVQIGVNGTRLNVVDRDAARSQLTRQPLREHLDGP